MAHHPALSPAYPIKPLTELQSRPKKFNKNFLLSVNTRFYCIDAKVPTGEKYTIDKVFPSMTVKELKDKIEVVTGIPRHLQKLRYLDDYDLEDDSFLSYVHFVPGATVKVLLWPEWDRLIKAACAGDYYEVLSCKIREPFRPGDLGKKSQFNEKATVALYIAAHRNHVQMVSRLVQAGVEPVKKLPSGRSPIHVAVDNGNVTCVSILIGRSQGIDVRDTKNDNAIRKSTFNSVAHLLQKKRGWKKLIRQFDVRKIRQAEKTKLPYMPRKDFQRIDSKHHSYLSGSCGRLYMCNILQTEAREYKKQYTKPWI